MSSGQTMEEGNMKQLSKRKLRRIRGGGNCAKDTVLAFVNQDQNGISGSVVFIRDNLGGPGNGVGNFASSEARATDCTFV